MEFRFDYGTVQASQPKPASGPLWAAIDGRVSPLAAEEIVFFDPISGRSHVMTQQVLQALDLCRSFRPMAEHVEAVAAALPGLQGKQAAVKPVLESLQTRGLMISDDAWLKRLQDVPPRTQAPVSGLFIRASNRPAQLSALLTSLLPRVSSLTCTQRIVVVDDSTSDATVAAHAKMLREFAANWPQSVHHVTPAIWRAIFDELSAELPEHAAALASVLLTGAEKKKGSGGSGRNLATLLAAGTRYLILDDDNLLPLNRMPGSSPLFDPNPPASRVFTFANHDAALAAGDEDEQAIAWHLSHCGRALGEVLTNEHGIPFGHAQLKDFSPSRHPALVAEARIAVTVNGHRGGSCSSTPHWLLTLNAASRAGLCESAASYATGRSDPSVCAGYDRPAMTRTATISPFAIDNSQLMPCTSPHGRAEDFIYNALVSALDGRSLQLLSPFSAGHRPEAGRERAHMLSVPRPIGFGLCVGEMIASAAADLNAARPEDRLKAVAARLDDLTLGSNESVQAYLREYLVYDRVQLLRQLQDALPAAQEAPQAFRDDIRTQIEVNARAIVERGVPRFTDVADNASADDCANKFRIEVTDLTHGLRAWPAAWELALTRREHWLERSRLRA